MQKLFSNLIGIALIGVMAATTAIGLEYTTSPERRLEAMNRVNPDTEIDRADTVRVSLSSGVMTWRDRSWKVQGSIHTPTGRFRLSDADTGVNWRMPESAFFIPFKGMKRSEMPRSHPYYSIVHQRKEPGTAFGIHKNNLQPGKVGAGCLLVSESDLLEMAQVLPGATIVITD